MATRASIKISDRKGRFVANIYHHWDGYPEHLGQKLLDIVDAGTIVNGLRMGSTGIQYNGFEDLACSIVSELKEETGGGGVYLYSESEYGELGEEYLYEIVENPNGGQPLVLVENLDGDTELVSDVLNRTLYH